MVRDAAVPHDRAHDAVVERNVVIGMRDGCRLRADVWRPLVAGRHPALLQRTPYDKNDSGASVVSAGLEPAAAVARGWVVVVQDVRGRGASEGEFEPFRNESADGFDTVEWVADQPWCTGEVFMYGTSYFGHAVLAAAAARPPHLRGIATHLTSSDVRDHWIRRGKAFQLGFCLTWGLALTAGLLRRNGSIEDIQRWEGLVASINRRFAENSAAISAEVKAMAPWIAQWRDTSPDDRFWGEVNAAVERIKVPALHIGGWYDLFVGGTLSDYLTLRRSDSQHVADGQSLVVGPWAHGSLTDAVGDLSFGVQASESALPITDLQLDWFEQVRAGKVTTPRVRVFTMGANRWQELDDWPPTNSVRTDLHFDRAESSRRGGLSIEPGLGTPYTELVIDPSEPVPTIGGATYLPGVHVGRNSGPRDRTGLEIRDDVAIFETGDLISPIHVCGPVYTVLHLTTTGPEFDCCVALVDVDQNGIGRVVCDGITRGRSTGDGSIERIVVDLTGTSMVFLTGHRLRVEISAANFPRFDSVWAGSGDTAARLRIFHSSSGLESSINLPVAPFLPCEKTTR